MRATKYLLKGVAAILAVMIPGIPVGATSTQPVSQVQNTPRDSVAACGRDAPVTVSSPLRLFFVADVHSGHDVFDRVIEDANRELPDLVLEGGDFVHDGTWAEFSRAYADRDRLKPTWYLAKGNHDANRGGPIPTDPPRPPGFKAFTCGGVRLIVLDNHEERINEEQFRLLEADLQAHHGKRIVVVMHVPPVLGHEPPLVRLRHLVPFELSSLTMTDPAEVARFTYLMSRYDVTAVLSAHTHFHDDQTIDGVRYIVAGTAAGLVPGLDIPQEYLDIEIDHRDVRVRRVILKRPAGNPVTFVARAFRFFARTNSFSHAKQGWNFIPSSSVQYRGGARVTEAGGGENAAVVAIASFERILSGEGRSSGFTDLGMSAASRELAAHVATGYKLRPVGDFNRNLYLAGAGIVNVGMLRGSGTAGIGARLETGVEWSGITIGLRRDWASNHRSASLVLGRRF